MFNTRHSFLFFKCVKWSTTNTVEKNSMNFLLLFDRKKKILTSASLKNSIQVIKKIFDNFFSFFFWLPKHQNVWFTYQLKKNIQKEMMKKTNIEIFRKMVFS